MVSDRIHKTLSQKSKMHQIELKRLGQGQEDAPLSQNVIVMEQKSQLVGINTLLLDPETSNDDFVFYFDRLTTMLVERAITCMHFDEVTVQTPINKDYAGLQVGGEISAVVILRGGTTLETGLKRVIPDCVTSRVLIQTSPRTGEPELHFTSLADDLRTHKRVLILDSQMSSGGAALMAVRVLIDHGVKESRIVFVTFMAGKLGLNRLMSVYPEIKVVACRVVDDLEVRWVEQRYLGC